MKQQTILTQLLFTAMLALVFFACKKEEDTSAPVLSRVRLLAKDSAVTGGFRGVWYTVQGEHLASTLKITVNDKEAFLNPTFIRNDNVVFAVPLDAPFRNVPDKIKVVTKYGEALIDFKVIAPPPAITSVAPLNVATGDIVTVKGTNLTSAGPGDVKMGNTVVEIQPGSTDTEMKIKVPAGERYGKLFFTVNGQTSASKEIISVVRTFYFQDNLSNYGGYGGWNGGWGSSEPGKLDSSIVRQGVSSWKFPYNQTWGTYQQGMWGTWPAFSVNDAKFLKLSVYVTMAPANEVKFEILIKNGVGASSAKVLTDVVKGGEWTELIIPLSAFGNPDKITEMQINQAPATTGGSIPNAGVNTVYLDEIGVL